jgi:hypothetical protein
MTRSPRLTGLLFAAAGFACAQSAGKGNASAEGAVQLHQEAGPFVITVFTSPSPLSVGPADISLLLQNRDRLDPVLDANVHVVLRDDASNIEIQAHPTRAPGRDKLLYAAPVMFVSPGRWRMAVIIERNGKTAETEGILDVARAPAKVSYAGYIAFPPVTIVLFAIRGRLIRRRSRR